MMRSRSAWADPSEIALLLTILQSHCTFVSKTAISAEEKDGCLALAVLPAAARQYHLRTLPSR
jgi:hypothetical protein